MISMVQPLPVGNALRLFLEPPAAATVWRVLRKGSDTFTGPDDAGAIVAYEGDSKVFLDVAFLQNSVMAFYRPYYSSDGGLTWVDGPTSSGTPAADYEEATTDALDLLRARLEAGLKVECDRGNFATQNGYIQVVNASPSLERDLEFPLVTLHLESEDPVVRGLGEDIAGDQFDGIGGAWVDGEGWISDVRITLIGWSLNADERSELRKAIRRVVLANGPVFAEFGIVMPSLSLSDNDAVSGEYPAPMYQVMGTFTCQAPVRVISTFSSVVEAVASRSYP